MDMTEFRNCREENATGHANRPAATRAGKRALADIKRQTNGARVHPPPKNQMNDQTSTFRVNG
eukprot:8787433-Lingulodinium_polyedra.AAC.1